MHIGESWEGEEGTLVQRPKGEESKAHEVAHSWDCYKSESSLLSRRYSIRNTQRSISTNRM